MRAYEGHGSSFSCALFGHANLGLVRYVSGGLATTCMWQRCGVRPSSALSAVLFSVVQRQTRGPMVERDCLSVTMSHESSARAARDKNATLVSRVHENGKEGSV